MRWRTPAPWLPMAATTIERMAVGIATGAVPPPRRGGRRLSRSDRRTVAAPSPIAVPLELPALLLFGAVILAIPASLIAMATASGASEHGPVGAVVPFIDGANIGGSG